MEEEGKKQVDSNLSSSSFPSSSSSSLADDIFGPKPTPSGTAFASIFPRPSQPKSVEFDNYNRNKDHHNTQEQRPQPCHLSSSIYYGGRDVYSDSNDNKDATRKSATMKKLDGGEDDSAGSASRGNWWQGSLYY